MLPCPVYIRTGTLCFVLQLAAECGLGVVQVRGHAATMRVPDMERSQTCSHCGNHEAAILCPQCGTEVYCSKLCLRSAKKKHRKSCVVAANAKNRKLQLACPSTKSSLPLTLDPKMMQVTMHEKEEWYQSSMCTSCTEICQRFAGEQHVAAPSVN